MKMVVSLFTMAALCMAVTTDSVAGGGNPVVHKQTNLLGKAIQNKSGDHVGYLEDLAIDNPSGRVMYAVVSTKNSLGLGGKLYALPLSAFTMASDYKHLILDVNKNAFENVEGFDNNRWPNKIDERWAKLGKKGPDLNIKEPNLLRLSSLNGLPVKNESGESLGKAAGFGVDCSHDKIAYVALNYGGLAGIGSKHFAIPWDAMNLKSLSLKVQDRAFVLNATKQDFENASGFDNNSWPLRGEERFMKNAKKSGAPSK